MISMTFCIPRGIRVGFLVARVMTQMRNALTKTPMRSALVTGIAPRLNNFSAAIDISILITKKALYSAPIVSVKSRKVKPRTFSKEVSVRALPQDAVAYWLKFEIDRIFPKKGAGSNPRNFKILLLLFGCTSRRDIESLFKGYFSCSNKFFMSLHCRI